MEVTEYFLELAAIDNVHPNEQEVLDYIKKKLDSFEIPYAQDSFGNIVAKLSSSKSRKPIALSGHVDIAAPLNGRTIIQEKDIIKTDGKSLLGGDDKVAVASMLWLAENVSHSKFQLGRPVELIFTVGEEAGLVGAKKLDYSLFTADEVLVFDWSGSVNRMIKRAPAYIKLDVEFIGKPAHPAEWQKGVNAGQYLMQAAGNLEQGEYKSGVTFNIGRVNIGSARNQVPGSAKIEAEVRSFNYEDALSSAEEIAAHFMNEAEKHKLKCVAELDSETAAYELDNTSELFNEVVEVLNKCNLKPLQEETYGCFDGNIFASHGKSVVILGAAYYNPHGPDEYVDTAEFHQLTDFIRKFCCT